MNLPFDGVLLAALLKSSSVDDKNLIVFPANAGIHFFQWRFSTASMDPRFREDDKPHDKNVIVFPANAGIHFF